PPEKKLGEEEDEIDDGQVQHDQGDLEMVDEPVVHSINILNGKQCPKKGAFMMIADKTLETRFLHRRPLGEGKRVRDTVYIFRVDRIAQFVFPVQVVQQPAVRDDAGL